MDPENPCVLSSGTRFYDEPEEMRLRDFFRKPGSSRTRGAAGRPVQGRPQQLGLEPGTLGRKREILAFREEIVYFVNKLRLFCKH